MAFKNVWLLYRLKAPHVLCVKNAPNNYSWNELLQCNYTGCTLSDSGCARFVFFFIFTGKKTNQT